MQIFTNKRKWRKQKPTKQNEMIRPTRTALHTVETPATSATMLTIKKMASRM